MIQQRNGVVYAIAIVSNKKICDVTRMQLYDHLQGSPACSNPFYYYVILTVQDL
jgi:hypothetical protein